jgi:enoyl-CoA hydratase/carnithine racemase
MDEALTREWRSAGDQIRADHDIRAVVVTGAGAVFSEGAELLWLEQAGAEGSDAPELLRMRLLNFYKAWLTAPMQSVPVIAAVNGPAVGAALSLALACDIRIASPRATFSSASAYIGARGGMGITELLPRTIGKPRAAEMLYTGRTVNADEALRWGLVTAVTANVVARALSVAEAIALAAPIPTRLVKLGLDQPRTFGASLEWEGLAQPLTLATSDMREGISARREGRSAKFRDV